MEAHGPPPPPGWYPDPEGGPRRRWWDGTRWSEHLEGVQPVGPPGPPRYSGAGWKIALAVFLALSLGIAGCFALVIDVGVNEVRKELRRHAITPEQFRSVERGARRSSVIEQLGVPPLAPGSFDDANVPAEARRDSCIVYSQKGTTLGFYEFCFRRGRLRTKRAY